MSHKLICPHCKRELYLSKSGICISADAFFAAQNAELIAQKLQEQGIEFGVIEGVKKNDE
jgi:hypothetical protein|nr:MAG TPA: RRN7 Zinc-finger of RNA-polymerase I-specific TFIIB, Rrn7 [Caudoviricetes sp.]DAZ46904.1 MAG TPA: RRN7 Zinc-finger of RNA-polymerase I-specific TFIIB, Rrn7 [Caudoviricetes sp.]